MSLMSVFQTEDCDPPQRAFRDAATGRTADTSAKSVVRGAVLWNVRSRESNPRCAPKDSNLHSVGVSRLPLPLGEMR